MNLRKSSSEIKETTNQNHKTESGPIMRADGTRSVSSDATSRYAELHAHSNYSFQEGASEIWDLLLTAKNIGLKAMAITDHDNITGAMEFSQAAK
ncbi:MAG: PHP domain-containing protein, partial [Chloroflexota bacterium]|nr:PHP domain-containing protein [Chloroflexota bacterium]